MTVIPQAVVIRSAAGPAVVARSSGFTFRLEEQALRTAVRFGRRPSGVRCPEAVFVARAEDGGTVFVVQAADLGEGDDTPIGFRLFAHGKGDSIDPFLLTDLFPPDWTARGTLPDLEWDGEPPSRPVAAVQAVLRAGDGPLLLGTTQALLDGHPVAVVRSAPDPGYVRGVWELLPSTARCELRPATFVFAGELEFDLSAAPVPVPNRLTDEQAKDYPEGRYELAVQLAVESGDQAELDRLFARASSRAVLRTAVAMVVLALAAVAALRFL